MPRTARIAPGGMIFHVLNRAIAHIRMFKKDKDFAAFERILCETLQQRPMRVSLLRALEPLALSAVARTGWGFGGVHAALDHRPRAELAGAPPRNWNRAPVPGAVQVVSCRGGRALPERSQICGAERLAPGLVSRAEQWRWGSLWRRCGGECEPAVTLAAWPMPIPQDWTEWVNGAEDRSELQRLRTSVYRGRPYGRVDWQQRVAQQLRLESSYRANGRPKRFAAG